MGVPYRAQSIQALLCVSPRQSEGCSRGGVWVAAAALPIPNGDILSAFRNRVVQRVATDNQI